jgi:hypothetical protein
MAEEQVKSVPKVERDVRIDFFRGLALYMILVDHVVGDPISKVTYQHFGFSDAAELFVFLSGVSCAIVYSRVLAKRGWTGLLTALARRTVKIYAFYLATSIIVIILICAAGSLATTSFIDNPFVSLDGNVSTAIWSAVLLTSPPALPGILVLYLMLTSIVIPLFLFGAARSSALTLVASATIWSIAQIFLGLSPHLAVHSYFNWLAWQFLFSIGMFLGLRRGLGSPDTQPTSPWLLTGAWSVVLGSFAYRLLLLAGPELGVKTDWLRLSAQTVIQMKDNLSALRLIHFLAVALLVATYFKSNSVFFKNVAAAAVIKSGRLSLEVFCLAAIFSVILNVIDVVDRPFVFAEALLDLAAISLILGVVYVLTERRVRARPIDWRRHSVRMRSAIQR